MSKSEKQSGLRNTGERNGDGQEKQDIGPVDAF
jgi:hypothetical protein